jgi:inorganic pyrophosphatase
MNLLHDISWGDTPEEITVIVEINKGSKNKYELDKTTGLIKLDRVMHTSQDYPCDYGFMPQSLWHDGDPLDVVLLTTYPLFPGCVLTARPVAVMHMIDGGEGDDKIIAVPTEDPRFKDVTDLADVNPHTLKEVQHFFETYKKIQNKTVEITGISGAEKAKASVLESVELYKNNK